MPRRGGGSRVSTNGPLCGVTSSAAVVSDWITLQSLGQESSFCLKHNRLVFRNWYYILCYHVFWSLLPEQSLPSSSSDRSNDLCQWVVAGGFAALPQVLFTDVQWKKKLARVQSLRGSAEPHRCRLSNALACTWSLKIHRTFSYFFKTTCEVVHVACFSLGLITLWSWGSPVCFTTSAVGCVQGKLSRQLCRSAVF